jgi:hypothetical protein
MPRVRRRSLFICLAILMTVGLLCLPPGRGHSFASSVYATTIGRLAASPGLKVPTNGPIPFVLDLSRHRRRPAAKGAGAEGQSSHARSSAAVPADSRIASSRREPGRAQLPGPCARISYQGPGELDLPPLPVREASGFATLEGVPVPGACIGVFTPAGRMLVAASPTDAAGNFEISGLPDGLYRLVGTSPSDAAATRLILVRANMESAQVLEVHLEAPSATDEPAGLVELADTRAPTGRN